MHMSVCSYVLGVVYLYECIYVYYIVCVCVRARACVCVCVRACVRVCVHAYAHKQCRLCTHNNRSINNSYVDTHPLLSPINSKICSINSVLHQQCSEYHQRVPLCSTVYSRPEVKNRFSVSISQVMFATSPIIL